jgi:hypothetical protein
VRGFVSAGPSRFSQRLEQREPVGLCFVRSWLKKNSAEAYRRPWFGGLHGGSTYVWFWDGFTCWGSDLAPML